MPDSGAVWEHFASAINAYRKAAHVVYWNRISLDVRQLGEYSVFATVHWNALDADGRVVRDTDELSPARDTGRVALPLVHQSLLSLRQDRP